MQDRLTDQIEIICLRGLVLSLLVSLFIVAASMSYKDAQDEQTLYCQMVKEKTWSDYKNIYEKACTKENE